MIGYVYFVQAENGLIKIGHTNHPPAKRLANLVAGSPIALKPLGIVRGYLSDERRFHAMFAESWHHAEWFNPTADLLELIAKRVQPWPAPDAADPIQTDQQRLETHRKNLGELLEWAAAMLRVGAHVEGQGVVRMP